MTCKQWKDEWVAYLYDELAEHEVDLVSEHLAACDSCRAEMEQLAGTRRLLQQSDPPVPTTPRVVVLQPKQRLRPSLAFAAGAVAAAVVFAIGVIAGPLWIDRPDETTPLSENPDALLSLAEEMVPRSEFEDALRMTRQEFEQRLAEVALADNPSAPPMEEGYVTRAMLDEGIFQLKRHVDAGLERDFMLLLQQVAASDARSRTGINSNRRALQEVTYAADPAIYEH